MGDSYQAIYDAVRSRVHGGNVAEAIQSAIREANIGHYFRLAQDEFAFNTRRVAEAMQRPSALYRPDISLDGNKWCALYGRDPMEGIAGFGDTVDAAMADFDKNWLSQIAPPPHRCPRCGEPNADRLDMDGCRDPDCPEQSPPSASAETEEGTGGET